MACIGVCRRPLIRTLISRNRMKIMARDLQHSETKEIYNQIKMYRTGHQAYRKIEPRSIMSWMKI